MSRRAKASLGGAALVIVFGVWPAYSEVIGPLVPRGRFELGLQERWVDRTEVSDSREEAWDQHDLSVVARWGVTDFATFSIEGMTGVGPWISDHDETQLFYLVGASAQASIWRSDRVIVTGAFHYTETLQRYEAAGSRTLQTTSRALEIMAETDARLWGGQFTFWGGPVSSDHSLTYPAGMTYQGQGYESDLDLGGFVGVSVLAWDHLNFSGHLLWVENPQPRVSILYRF